MATLPRLKMAGVPQHVVQRGNNRAACFFAEADYLAYLHWLRRGADLYRVRIHAYVLMTNHTHLLLSPNKQDGTARLMQYLGRHYVNYVNRALDRTGTLWEGRYKSCLVDSERYLLAVYRYIEHNPVRAGMVARAEEYRWSSAAQHLGITSTDWIDDHEAFVRLGTTATERAAHYRALCAEPLEGHDLDELRCALNQGHAFGGDRFKDEIEKVTARRVRVAQSGRPKRRQAAAARVQLGLEV